MEQIITIDKQNIEHYIAEKRVLVAQMRNSRSKCKRLAVLELLQLLIGFQPIFLKNGPLGDVKGCISFLLSFDEKNQSDVLKRCLDGAGYTHVFYLLDFDNGEQTETNLKSINPQIWKGHCFLIRDFFQQEQKAFRSQAADKRSFFLLCDDGQIREIHGYRGDGTDMGKRGLPVEDCRLLFNLSCNIRNEHFCDPFSGAGGIVYQARYINSNITVSSSDIAPELAPGLLYYGAHHFVGEAAEFIPECKIDALATEVPFSPTATEAIYNSIIHLRNYMTSNCRIVIMCAPYQVECIKSSLCEAGCYIGEIFDVDRKGTEVAIVLAFCDKQAHDDFKELWSVLKLVY